MLLCGYSLKKRSDEVIKDYLLENGLGKTFKPWCSGSYHNLVRYNTTAEYQACTSENEVHSYFTSANISVEISLHASKH